MEELDFKRPKKIVGKLISVDVLDKIKAEIQAMPTDYRGAYIGLSKESKEEVLQIIDKYRK